MHFYSPENKMGHMMWPILFGDYWAMQEIG